MNSFLADGDAQGGVKSYRTLEPFI